VRGTGKQARAMADADAAPSAEEVAADAAVEGINSSAVPRNEVGGVLVTEAELDSAFKFFDAKGTGTVGSAQLKERLAIFPKDALGAGFEGKSLLGPEVTKKSLSKLLRTNKVEDFDPVAEAFKLFDPSGEGHVDIKLLSKLFVGMGLGELSSEEVQLIRRSSAGPSGYISLDDFRNMFPAEPPKERDD